LHPPYVNEGGERAHTARTNILAPSMKQKENAYFIYYLGVLTNMLGKAIPDITKHGQQHKEYLRKLTFQLKTS
jgi:hypothetical protein